MHTRKLQALLACLLFPCAAALYGVISGGSVDIVRVAVWSAAGVVSYILLSNVFGFDPDRSRVAHRAPAFIRYVDRWELRLGQATLSMLGCIAIAAHVLDRAHFVTAVASGTLAAWTYFALRLYAGGYDASRRNA